MSAQEADLVPDKGNLVWGPYDSVFDAIRGLLEKMWEEAHMWYTQFPNAPWTTKRVDALLAGIIELEHGSYSHIEVDGVRFGVHPEEQEDWYQG